MNTPSENGPDRHESTTEDNANAAPPSESFEQASVQPATTHPKRSQDAPAWYGVVSWFTFALLIFALVTVWSIESGIAPTDNLHNFPWYLVLTAPFLAGYYLRNARARLGCFGLILAGSVLTFFLVDEGNDSGDPVSELAVIAVLLIWFAVVISVLLGALSGSVVRRVYRRKHAAAA